MTLEAIGEGEEEEEEEEEEEAEEADAEREGASAGDQRNSACPAKTPVSTTKTVTPVPAAENSRLKEVSSSPPSLFLLERGSGEESRARCQGASSCVRG
jgi:hypothetical protein